MPTSKRVLPTGPSMFEVLKELSSLQRMAIIRPDNPPPGIAGFLFDVQGDEVTEFASEISPHYAEDNTTLNDQIALRPVTARVSGLVAELTDNLMADEPWERIFETMPINSAFIPELTAQALEGAVSDELAKIALQDQFIGTPSLYTEYQNKLPQQPGDTRQSAAFSYFYQLWLARQLFTVETPWGFFKNMALAAVRSEQTEDTRYLSNFTLVFQQMRFAREVTVNAGQLAGRRQFQANASTPTQNGAAGQTALSTAEQGSILHDWATAGIPGG